jgi:glycosyltransferase involved in cell wall biosynthesis
VGQGPLEGEIRAEHARLDLGDAVLILGERPDAIRVMSGCDAFVLASDNEGLPVALMEALALGLPIVATRVGGVPEAVTEGEDAVLVPPSDPDALANAMAELAADPARRAAMTAAATVDAQRFAIGRTVARVEAVYDEVLAGRVVRT